MNATSRWYLNWSGTSQPDGRTKNHLWVPEARSTTTIAVQFGALLRDKIYLDLPIPKSAWTPTFSILVFNIMRSVQNLLTQRLRKTKSWMLYLTSRHKTRTTRGSQLHPLQYDDQRPHHCNRKKTWHILFIMCLWRHCMVHHQQHCPSRRSYESGELENMGLWADCNKMTVSPEKIVFQLFTLSTNYHT